MAVMRMHILLSQILKEKGATVHSIAPDISALECAKKLTELNIGALLVLAQDKMVGIISERDLVAKLLSRQGDPAKLNIQHLMSKEVVTVSSDMTVQAAMKLVTERRCRHLPVIDEGRLVGIISIGDLTKAVMLEQEQEINDLTGYIQGTPLV